MKDLLCEILFALLLIGTVAYIAMPPDEPPCKFPCNEYDWTMKKPWISLKQLKKADVK